MHIYRKRSALIIWFCDELNGAPKGPAVDADNLYWYLRSQLGGMWMDYEITCLRNPKEKDILHAVERQHKDSAYTFTYYSGGASFPEKKGDLYLHLADGKSPMGILEHHAPRRQFILECNKADHQMKTGRRISKKLWVTDPEEYWLDSRFLFDMSLEWTEEGAHLAICGLPNAKGKMPDTCPNYLQALLKIASNFNKRDSEYNVADLGYMRPIAQGMLRRELQMNPRILFLKGRKGHFPFAVKAIGLKKVFIPVEWVEPRQGAAPSGERSAESGECVE